MDKINDIDLSEFLDQVVLTTYDTYIQGLVTFFHPILVTKEVFVETGLWSETIMGIDIKEWLKKAVFINKGFIAGLKYYHSKVFNHSTLINFR